jgi:hypothetical protein
MRLVYERHGLAMYEAQMFERYLAHAALAGTDLTGEQFHDEECRVRKLPIGRLIRRLGDVTVVPSRFGDRLEAARVSRNLLAHEYFARRSELLQTRKGQADIIRELDEMSDEFYRLWGVLDAAIVAWFSRSEPKTEDFTEDFAKAIAEA